MAMPAAPRIAPIVTGFAPSCCKYKGWKIKNIPSPTPHIINEMPRRSKFGLIDEYLIWSHVL
jgi:hypothetical protein